MLAETGCGKRPWPGRVCSQPLPYLGKGRPGFCRYSCGTAGAIKPSAQQPHALQPSRGQPGLPASSVERTSVTITIMAWQDMQAAILRLAGAVTEVRSADICGHAGAAMPS